VAGPSASIMALAIQAASVRHKHFGTGGKRRSRTQCHTECPQVADVPIEVGILVKDVRRVRGRCDD